MRPTTTERELWPRTRRPSRTPSSRPSTEHAPWYVIPREPQMVSRPRDLADRRRHHGGDGPAKLPPRRSTSQDIRANTMQRSKRGRKIRRRGLQGRAQEVGPLRPRAVARPSTPRGQETPGGCDNLHAHAVVKPIQNRAPIGSSSALRTEIVGLFFLLLWHDNGPNTAGVAEGERRSGAVGEASRRGQISLPASPGNGLRLVEAGSREAGWWRRRGEWPGEFPLDREHAWKPLMTQHGSGPNGAGL